ncbi:peroxiredoxin (alkyl hydroperoxide reductase subunit C) [Desulfonatronum thiosulfatophilum]|uniref:Peroxiredoxin (Alkyl hydroperoxide reductase subunit C) n=1 Tax=Desulfonatronum thiosulfatophilum TaxID=617002 RepID=A0A1G6BKC6_9BACT|nr:redoxin domain-containing protein [Desulfonatronum thiosulfatophilum]SDB21090.1 peroxiredoxin (alkyl hydroperoxide reductase subunit C) [Desulfonatronum thiosulfatophilum]
MPPIILSKLRFAILGIFLAFALVYVPKNAKAENSSRVMDQVYQVHDLQPIDSELKVQVGDIAPDFTLSAVDGETIILSDYRGRKNVMLSFVPAAWTPVCSDQWPGYNILKDVFNEHETVILGISVDNIPTLYSWVQAMGGLWFPVLSDFWPHGQAAQSYGVLRSDGTTERALIFIDKDGEIRFLHVQDINIRPPLEVVIQGLQSLTAAEAAP